MVADRQGGEESRRSEGRAHEGDLRMRRGTLAALCGNAFFADALSRNRDPHPGRLFPAGTAPDVAARMIADKMTVSLGKPVVVENISGANGNIACDRVAKATPDGYTLVMCGNGSLVFAPSLYEKLPYDPAKDFAPIARSSSARNLLVVHPDVPAKSLAELIALARAKPGELTYAHTGVGSSQHLAANCSSRWRR